MEREEIVRYLKNRQRGIYPIIVQHYADRIIGLGKRIALDIIKNDLEKFSGEKIDVSYFSLAKAISKYLKMNGRKVEHFVPKESLPKSSRFKNAYEYPDSDNMRPGAFRLEED